MSTTRAELRDERLQKLFLECQDKVIAQIIGPFGLSTAMFEDKNGGNVTTLHNFSRDDDAYVATTNDKMIHEKSKEEYSSETRKQYEIKTKNSANGGKTWRQMRQDKIDQTGSADAYTGNITDNPQLDHVVSIGEIHRNPKFHLALGQVNDGEVTVDRIRQIINSEKNLALTDGSINISKSDEDLKEWLKKTDKDGKTNAERYGIDDEAANTLYKEANNSIHSTANKALLKKHTTELLQTGGMQALQMGGRQALGILLTELVNGLFNEFKLLIRHGVEIGKTLIQEITERLKKVAISVAKKIPDALSQGLQGGVSGFVSNLLTFLINTFLSTAKQFVTVIREGLLGLYRAFKMIFFPPAHMTPDQALQEGIKILTVVITTSVGILLQESVKTFLSSMPFLLLIAETLSAVLIGIITGLLSAFLAYQIDCLFDRLRFSHDERMMDQLMADTKFQGEFASGLIALTQSSLDNVRMYSEAANLNEEIYGILKNSKELSDATLDSLYETVSSTDDQVKRSWEAVAKFEDSHRLIDSFLDGEK
jgi:hypothetical protein